jgi:BolA family transcriptional regulator, general stress-responsive regulator
MKIFDTRLILKNSIESLEKLLRSSLKIEFLGVVDESSSHAGHAGIRHSADPITHIYIRVRAAELENLSRVAQHRQLYAILQPAIDNGLHSVRFEIL